MIDPRNPDFEDTPASGRRPVFGYRLAEPDAPPYVTIATPFYNTGEVFRETARSVLRQSFQQWQWLIVDDASTSEEALELLEEYRRLDSRIRVIRHQRNRGPGAARNTAFKAAKTAYVVQLDSDDLLESTAIEKWLWFLESYPDFSFVKGFEFGFGASNYAYSEGFHSGAEFLVRNMVQTTSMVRKSVHDEVGGYDESILEGLEDWDFWLRCAHSGYWGGTVPEYLNWYRRRESHGWRDWDDGERQQKFGDRLKRKYSKLWQPGGFPSIEIPWQEPWAFVSGEIPCANRLAKSKPRLLALLPWLTIGGSDRFNLDLIQQITEAGWQVTLATTLNADDSCYPDFARYTEDIFILEHVVRPVDYPRFLRYLIDSRQPDVVLVSHSELGYQLLPYLRSHCPQASFVDFCHIEEEYWNSGGYPRMSIEYRRHLDLAIVSSRHLKRWMTSRGAASEDVAVSYTNIDTAVTRPDPAVRQRVRRELEIPEEIPVIIYPARIHPQKQPAVFANVMLRLHRGGHDFTALVAGDGEDREWLETFLEDHGLTSTVVMLGRVPFERARELLKASDILFLPSMWEGIALTLFEAMATGLAVVGADVGGQRELAAEDAAILIEPGSEPEEIASYTAILCQLLAEPDRRQALGEKARRRVCDRFRLEQMRDRMLELFDRALERRDRRLGQAGVTACGDDVEFSATLAIEYTRLKKVADGMWVSMAEKERALEERCARRVEQLEQEHRRIVRDHQLQLDRLRRDASAMHETLSYAPYRIVTFLDHRLRKAPRLRSVVLAPLSRLWKLLRGSRASTTAGR